MISPHFQRLMLRTFFQSVSFHVHLYPDCFFCPAGSRREIHENENGSAGSCERIRGGRGPGNLQAAPRPVIASGSPSPPPHLPSPRANSTAARRDRIVIDFEDETTKNKEKGKGRRSIWPLKGSAKRSMRNIIPK